MQKLSTLEDRRRQTLRGRSPAAPDGLLDRYCEWLDESRSLARRELEKLQMDFAYETYCLNEVREESRRHSINGERRSNALSRKHVENIERIQDQLVAQAAGSPDAFYVQNEARLKRDMKNQQVNRLVNVPYLERAKKQIQTSLEAGIPVYLVGHLGSGKTQLAMECAENFMRKRLLQKRLREAMQACPDSVAERDYFARSYPQIRSEVEAEDCRPYFIAGSHNLTTEDMFFEKTLKLTRDGDAYGTTVEKIEKEVLKAIREGRPLVIDEINTIAMANLIGLNDILQHHAGQTAYITGVGAVKIHEGFCLIGTGNLSTGTVSYEGTNVLNPAFQSRFTTIVYNYVPQNTTGELEEQSCPENNELFRLIIDHLCSEDRNLYLPKPAVTLPKLFHLAQLARVSQNIFEGRSSTVNADGDTPVLNEAVLSVRNLIHVLDHWNFGEEEDLSMALWNGFLSSVTNADDRNLLLALSVRFGFFSEQEGWHIDTRGRGDSALSYDDIRTQAYRHHILPLETLSAEDVVYLLFGNGPKRSTLPKELYREILIDENAGENIPTAEKLDAAIRNLERGALILEQRDSSGTSA